jgi:hypothetical protein
VGYVIAITFAYLAFPLGFAAGSVALGTLCNLFA